MGVKLFGPLSALGLSIFAVFLAVSVYCFTIVQLLPPGNAWLAPIIPFRGAYGNVQLLPGIDYTHGLEISGLISFFGLFIFRFGSKGGTAPKQRILLSLSTPMRFFGILVASIIYVEIHLLWGEFWYGAKFLNLNPAGFPWGSERVASNTCFLPTTGDNCLFLNYDQLMLLAIGAFILGWLILRWSKRSDFVSR